MSAKAPARWRQHLSAGIAAAFWLFSSQGQAQSISPAATVTLTRFGAGNDGRLADPQPIRLAPRSTTQDVFLSGTTKAIVRCTFPPQPEACGWTAIRVDAADLAPAMTAAGVSLTNIQNTNIFQADDGSWHAAVTIGVRSAAHPRHWTVVAHAHPSGPGADGIRCRWQPLAPPATLF